MARPIPSPPGLPIVGNLFDIVNNDPEDHYTLRPMERLADEYGPIYKLKIKGTERIFIANHELFEEVCDETRFFKAAPPVLASNAKDGGTPGLFTAPTEKHPDWQQAHRILMPAFGPTSIRDMFDEMHDIASQLVLKWARKCPDYQIPVTNDFTRLTLDTIALCAMDYRFNSFYQDEMHPFVQAMTNTLTARQDRQRIPQFVQRFMWSSNEQLRADGELQQKVAAELVANRREHPTEKKDLLNAMINGKDPKTGEGMRDALIASNMITFLIAGHETTSGLLSFAFYYILKNPATYFKAQQEVDSVIGKGKITANHLKGLKYINAILRETLRLTPTAPAFSRHVRDENKEDPPTIGKGEFELKKGLTITCLLGKIQRDPKVYGDDAEEFRPERMVDEEFEKLPKSAWKPFGTGLRACIGRAFAWQEALLVMALLLQNFDFRMDDPTYELKIKSTLTIKPEDFFMRAALRKGISATTLQHSLSLSSAEQVSQIASKSSDSTATTGGSSKPMTILYGSNTGTCQSFAQKLAADARAHGFGATVQGLDVGVNALPTGQPLVIITASYEGQPTDDAAQFVAWLESMEDGEQLRGVQYTVFGCGHKDWAATFHRIPKLIDEKLEAFGAERIVPQGLSDASQGDMFSDFDSWLDQSFWPGISQIFGGQDPDTSQEPTLELEISTKSRASHLQHDLHQGKVLFANSLTAHGEPEKHHLEIKLPEGLEYTAGDYLTVLPMNPDESVHRVLNRFSLPWDAVITIKEGGPVTLPAGKPVSVFELLKGFVELSLPASKKNIKTCIDHVLDKDARAALTDLLKHKYQEDVVEKRTSVLDLIELHPQVALPFSQFLAMLPPMRPRHYSISSSPLKDPTTCSITYGVINTLSLSGTGEQFQGVAGTYLRSLRSGDVVQVGVRSAPAPFHLPPSPDTPLIMFCNGTGLAPFRGFVQQRAVQLAANPHQKLAPALLFIGCRTSSSDSLYKGELAEWAKAGAVDVRYAYSREPDHKDAAGCKYVQDRMQKDWQEVSELWKAGSRVYLCGSPDMVRGSRKIARDMVQEDHRDASSEQIEAFFQGMRNERIAVDVFA